MELKVKMLKPSGNIVEIPYARHSEATDPDVQKGFEAQCEAKRKACIAKHEGRGWSADPKKISDALKVLADNVGKDPEDKQAAVRAKTLKDNNEAKRKRLLDASKEALKG